MEKLIAGKYKSYQKIGSGAFGEIFYGMINSYLGINIYTGEEVAIKKVFSYYFRK